MSEPQDRFGQAYQLHQSGRIPEAINLYIKILPEQQDNAELLFLLGTAYLQVGQLRQGVEQLQRAVVLNPNNVDAHCNLGVALNSLKRLDEALASYDKALAIRPDHVEASNNRGVILAGLKRFDEAVASFDWALAIKPDYAEAYNNRGGALYDLKRLDEALASFDRAVAIKPDYAEAYHTRGAVLQELMRLDEALASFDHALANRRDYAEAYYNRGNVLRDLRRMDEALASYDRALAIKPDHADTHWNKSLLLILIGEFLEGWALYEWRFNIDALKDHYRTFPKPSWRGEDDIQGKRLLIQAEQGFGDTIQFCRYLSQVKGLGAEIIFEVPKHLVALVSTMHCPMTVVARGNPLPEFDAYCPLMSLPYVFKTTVETIPEQIPYLFADKNKVQQWRQKLGNKDRLRVGLTWSGLAAHKNDMNRSIRLDGLLPLLDLPVQWHSLQKDYRPHDLAVLERHPQIQQHQDDLEDFADTAALLDCLDLVISVDTSVVHLAGAMGKPVWVLLPYAPDYRWMLDREDTPWYPTATLYRQPEAGDWQSVIRQVRSGIEVLLTSSPA